MNVRPLIAALLVGLVALVALPAAAGAAKMRDRDHDRMSDRWERKHHLNTRKNDARGDADRDGLRNITEFRSHTDPRDADTDGDGRRDGREDSDHDGLNNREEERSGHDAGDRDSDDDGTEDGDEMVGSVVSFTGTTLVIKLNDGSQVTGTVTPGTEIECEHSETPPTATKASDDDDGDKSDDDDEAKDDDEGERDEDDGDDCGTDVLTVGAIVHEAELEAGTTGATWTELEILR